MDDDMTAMVLEDARDKMAKALEHVKTDFGSVRTGRATPALVEGLMVDYYGTPTPVSQMASVSVPEPRLLVIKPFDAQMIKAIEQTILQSPLGLTPQNDGKIIRINVPPLSTERRKEMVQRIGKMKEEAKVAIRNVRRDANKHAEQGEKDKLMTEDEAKACKEEIQNLTKKYEGDVDAAADSKEKDIMQN